MRLSDFELDVMHVIWSADEATAPSIHEAISREREVTYSTVKTIVDRLEAKGAVQRARQVGRTICYEAAVAPEDVRRPMLEAFVSRVFGGDRRPLLNQLLEGERLSEEEIDYLETLIADRRSGGEP